MTTSQPVANVGYFVVHQGEHSIWTSFTRLDAPRLMETDDLRHPKCLATSPINSALALPSAGGDRSCADQTPVSSWRNTLAAAFGRTLISMNCRPDMRGIASDVPSNWTIPDFADSARLR
jgi:hypothetical protein